LKQETPIDQLKRALDYNNIKSLISRSLACGIISLGMIYVPAFIATSLLRDELKTINTQSLKG
jgi:hypothetical protein